MLIYWEPDLPLSKDYISRKQLEVLSQTMFQSEYGKYLMNILKK